MDPNMTHPKILEMAKQVTAKRAKTVIDHIIQHGSIDNEILKDTYGYSHPPRAIRDVRECGIPLVTGKTTAKDGRKIGCYHFGNPDEIENFKLAGRQTFPKKFKSDLVTLYGSMDTLTGTPYDARYLQIDHRVPFEVAGDDTSNELDPTKFMLLTGASQRQKSFSCEQCNNLKKEKDIAICDKCYWANPESYEHIALRNIRQVTVTFEGDDIELFDSLKLSDDSNDLLITLIKNHLKTAGDK